MADHRKSEVSSRATKRCEWLLSDPRIRVTVRVLECVAAVIALGILFLTVEERDDRRDSRSFRAWNIVLDTTRLAVQAEEQQDGLFYTSENYKGIVSRITADALTFLKNHKHSLDGVVLPRTSLARIELSKARLNRVDFTHADLSGANFTEAILRDAKLDGATLFETDFTRTNLHYALLKNAELSGAIFKDADLTSANLSCAKNLTQEQLDEACADPRWPPVIQTKDCDDDRTRKDVKWSNRQCPK